MNLCQVSTAGVAILFKKLNSEASLAVFDWMFIKASFSLICTIIVAKLMNKRITFSADPWLLLRGVLGNSSFMLYAYAFTLLSIGQVMVLYQTSPFWVCILAYLINREPILKIDQAGMAVCFLCVIVISMTKPGGGGEEQSLLSQLYGSCVCILMAWFFAGGNVISRKMKHIHFTQIIFVQQMMAFTISCFYFVVSRIVAQTESS